METPKETRKKILIEKRLHRKLETCAKGKNMTVQEYVDFLLKDSPRKLSEQEKTQQLKEIFLP